MTLVKQQCPGFIRLIHHKAVRNPKTALGGPWLFRAHLSPSRNHPGIRLDQLGAIWSHFAPSCSNFGPSWSHLGATLRHLETVLGPLGPTGNPECWVVEVKSGHEANPFLSILGKAALNTFFSGSLLFGCPKYGCPLDYCICCRGLRTASKPKVPIGTWGEKILVYLGPLSVKKAREACGAPRVDQTDHGGSGTLGGTQKGSGPPVWPQGALKPWGAVGPPWRPKVASGGGLWHPHGSL